MTSKPHPSLAQGRDDESLMQERLEDANALIGVISSHGRQFFLNKENGKLARLELFFGSVHIVDEFSGARVPTGVTSRWEGFSHGYTLRCLIEFMRDYIMTGRKIPQGVVAPKRAENSRFDMWAYGDLASEEIRSAASRLPIIAELVESA